MLTYKVYLDVHCKRVYKARYCMSAMQWRDDGVRGAVVPAPSSATSEGTCSPPPTLPYSPPALLYLHSPRTVCTALHLPALVQQQLEAQEGER